MEMCLLDALAMVSLRVGEAEESLLEEGTALWSAFRVHRHGPGRCCKHALFPVPKGKGNILEAMSITDASYTIFTPSECS